MEKMVKRLVLTCALAALAAACGGGTPAGAVDPNNELPFGYVDSPAAGTVVRGNRLAVTGWALDDTGVDHVRVYVDGRYRGEAKLTGARPDVARGYPAYAHGSETFGWGIELTIELTPGGHALLAQAVDTSGATRDIGTVVFSAAAAKRQGS